jgi:hypothetical protein
MLRPIGGQMKILAVALILGLLSSYGFADDVAGQYRRKDGAGLQVSSDGPDQITLKMSAAYQMNSCHMDTGKLTVKNGAVVYKDSHDTNCTLRVKLVPTKATVDQDGDCGCGLNVTLKGVYIKQRGPVDK